MGTWLKDLFKLSLSNRNVTPLIYLLPVVGRVISISWQNFFLYKKTLWSFNWLYLSKLGNFWLCANIHLFGGVCILGPIFFQHLRLNHSFNEMTDFLVEYWTCCVKHLRNTCLSPGSCPLVHMDDTAGLSQWEMWLKMSLRSFVNAYFCSSLTNFKKPIALEQFLLWLKL